MKTEYQVCSINKETGTAVVLGTIDADSIQAAIKAANTQYSHDGLRIRTYPLVDLDSPSTIYAMARYTLNIFENWERRNNGAVLNPQERNQWDREDYIQDAVVSILSTLADNPAATMYDVGTAAYALIAARQKAKQRKSEREYNPGLLVCNIQPRRPRPTCPALDRLIRAAVDDVAPTLAPAQYEVFDLSYNGGMSAADIAEETGKARVTVYQNLYRAYYWVLLKAAEMDGESLDTFRLAGYTSADIGETLVTLRKRGRMTKSQK